VRIIAGTARGRRLETLPGEATRPTQGKVREALFSALTPWVPQADWLDLFAGSGAVGLEAASRGARRVLLVERAPEALRVIEANRHSTQLPVECWALDAAHAVERLRGESFDVIFLDPPYAYDAEPLLVVLNAGALLKPTGRLVWEHAATRRPPERVDGLQLLKTRRYSGTALSFYGNAADSKSTV
jgi:16S rRNA (guanine(966)-N(2))-methyltransferase RsmD